MTEQTVNYRAVRWEDHLLPPPAAKESEELRAALTRQWAAADETERPRLREAVACLDRLSAFCLQVSRMAAHARTLETQPIPEQLVAGQALRRGEAVMRTFDEACTDFESLLFHGRAALDVLSTGNSPRASLA